MPPRTTLRVLLATACVTVLAACGPLDAPSDAGAAAPSRTSPAAVADQVDKARAMLGRLTVAGRAPKTGYDRVGGYGQAWADVTRSGCGTRDNVLARDLTAVERRNACTVVAGRLDDPYTGKTITFRKAEATAVQIDHVVPLALSWQLGAQRWPAGKRVAFANDPLNLIAVDGPTNAQKSASGPDAWLPPDKAYRCTYVIRFTRVAAWYALRVTAPMKAAIGRVLDDCRRVEGKPADLAPLPQSVWAYAARFASHEAASETGRSCPSSAPVKGNIPTGGGDRIFHVPGSSSYEVTIPERCFATATDAKAAGFRAPR